MWGALWMVLLLGLAECRPLTDAELANLISTDASDKAFGEELKHYLATNPQPGVLVNGFRRLAKIKEKLDQKQGNGGRFRNCYFSPIQCRLGT